jgi:two-component system cell cycle response regulator DivK
LKADPAFQEILIVAVTAYAMKGDEEKARAAGCDGYIPKPLDVQTFASQVAEHLKK